MRQDLFSFHKYNDDGVSWRLTIDGIEIEHQGIPRSPGRASTVTSIWKDFGASIEKWSKEYLVPAELIVACIATESRGFEKACRVEPGYKNDFITPNKVSPGLMQTLISTARSTLMKRKVPIAQITREWLFIADNSIRAGASYIEEQSRITGFDPVYVAAAYNAGGLYFQEGLANRFKLRCYPIGTSEHIDRFITWFNDFYFLINSGEAKPSLTLKYKEKK